MNKFKLYFVFLLTAIGFVSCQKDDNKTEPPRDRSQQYIADNDSIEKYLKNHYIKEFSMVNGLPEVVFDSIKDPQTQVSIWDNTQYPLRFKMVKNDNRKTTKVDGVSDDKVEYKLYYLVFNPGGGKSGTTIDSIYTSYKGWKLNDDVFDFRDAPFWSTYPQMVQNETTVLSGYRQFLPELKSAISTTTNDDGTISYNDLGMGVVFIPSGLGYYNSAQASIPAYSPLVFRVRLHAVRDRDHDRDGILSKNEDLDANLDAFNDDTDGDNIPNFLDTDDDGDGYSSLFEIQENGTIVFPYPTCDSGIPKYLDKTCHPPKKTN